MEAFLFPALILAAFYFLIIRPGRTRQRAALELQQRLEPGLEVVTTSGMYGRVADVEDDAVALEVSPGVTVRLSKAAVGRIVTEAPDAGPEPGDDAAGDADGLDDRPSR